jgi:proteic killer suppression protein
MGFMDGPNHHRPGHLSAVLEGLLRPSAASSQPMPKSRAPCRIPVFNAAHRLDDLLVPPLNRLEKLKGNLKGLFSIRINDQWRVIFKWIDGDAYEVRVVDYH